MAGDFSPVTMFLISQGECGDKQNLCNGDNRRIFSAHTQVKIWLKFALFLILIEFLIKSFRDIKSERWNGW